MTARSTLFISPRYVAYDSDVDDAGLADFASYYPVSQVLHNVLWRQIGTLSLASGATAPLSFGQSLVLSDWAFVMARVVGSARINTSAKDFDGEAAITGKLAAQGTTLTPGIAIVSTYNLISATVESLANDTLVSVFAAILAEDDDPRLDT